MVLGVQIVWIYIIGALILGAFLLSARTHKKVSAKKRHHRRKIMEQHARVHRPHAHSH